MKYETKIVFMGTPEFGAVVLEGLCKANYEPILVVTSPDKPIGRKQILTPPAAKVVAQRCNIPVLQPDEKLIAYSLRLTALKPDLIIVAAYGQILPKEILDIPKHGCLNVHPSLLPKYRGSSPIQYAILNGDKETGVTIILMDEQMDHGPILAQRKTIIGSNETAKQLHDRLAILGAKLLIDTIPDWVNNCVQLQPQDEEKATYTKILKKEDGKINWRKPAQDIERQIRAFDPWPGAWTFWQIIKGTTIRIKILKARVFKSPIKADHRIGKILVVPPNEIGVQCGKDLLAIQILQQEGKKPTGSEEFLRGHPDFIGTILK